MATIIVPLVAGYGSFVASSHFVDYYCHVYGQTCSWLRVTFGYEFNLSGDVIIFTVYPVAGYGSFVASSRSRELRHDSHIFSVSCSWLVVIHGYRLISRVTS